MIKTSRGAAPGPYHHGNLGPALVEAALALLDEARAERTLSSLEGLTNAWARLLACGQAFVAHGIANPALYRLMFSAVLTSFDAGRPPIDATAGQVKPWEFLGFRPYLFRNQWPC